MSVPSSTEANRKRIWACVYRELVRHAIPDSRFDFDFLSFALDFRGSAAAVDRVREQNCYKDARTVLITCDNSLEGLRHQALQDGKKVLVGTYRLRRGFVLLDPSRIDGADLRLAACLDGMEKPGLGRAVSLMQLRDEGLHIDICVMGGLVFNQDGVVLHEGQALFEVQWALLQDIKILANTTPVIAVVHACQVVDEVSMGMEKTSPNKPGEVQCDLIITPDRTFEIEAAVKSASGIDFDNVDAEALNNIQPLQELRGIRSMEQIMAKGGFGQENRKDGEKPKAPTAEEQMGIDIIEKLMKGYKA
ncbi:hypothetical protein HBI56_001250 [Parastagonospora nodorum]|nr:hypothetical protein HBI10_037500 [Parastagonospora nodorum]KAH4032758.1 hypothetical protein HBI13_001660 [Parastagonospora nodorum]KAH4061266.1 hypothetical protein HBH49_012940 [Parastagonospora nodorum]KAH4072827.1 hypothetical protein HBH50_064680 [Parastagonospora nodorum]KAH4099021.1 hypothetical protein HBH48_001670 [Parastagonospora nodorum]